MNGKTRQPRASGESSAPGSPEPQEPAGRLSRGEFLTALSAGALAAFLSPGWAGSLPDLDNLPAEIEAGEQFPTRQERMASEAITVHAYLSFASPQVGERRQNAGLELRAYGDARPAHNRVWWQLEQRAYAHSARDLRRYGGSHLATFPIWTGHIF
jgi:hypothetical protein